MTIKDLDHSEYNAFYRNYVELVRNDVHLLDALRNGKQKNVTFYNEIPEEKWHYAYESGKWTILEVLQHVIDTERIFSYRALRIGRGDKTPLAGFEQDDYIKPSQANECSMQELVEEYSLVRDCTINLFKGFNDEALANTGTSSDAALSTRAAGFIICGHEVHHANIIYTRYLNS
ncbi:DinB family protein [Leeuwenhoekiella marinoflava]|uniref:DinB family protein n=2 Tax=Leeuwenhoekiella marinoflava TaxID=988 RepID=A0A4Q0PBL0_9FLAO|nr:DinB family protein [Leeuwenhoekiella marinoflava]RXG24117.1 DinB family protein [Leeuwenhoekiella marinoflava]SHF98181.1 DinB superfamily protein [Leeuwenhoekiella marinoflava DSM 3653]